MALNKLGSGAAALGMLAAASSPALAEGAEKSNQAIQLASYTVEQVDCVAHVKNQRKVRKEAGDPMSRKEMKLSLMDCRNNNLNMEIAAQEEYIAELDQKLASLDLEIDQNAQILDEQGRIIGRLISVQGQLEIQRSTISDLEAQIIAKAKEIAAIKFDTARSNANADKFDADAARSNMNANQLEADTARLNAEIQVKLDQAEAILRALVV